MASNKTKNTQAKKALEKESSMSVDTVEETKVVEEVKSPAPAPAKKVELTDSDMIEVKSFVNRLSYTDTTTGLRYRWESRGEIVDMTYGELKVMMRTTPNMLKRLFVVIDNQEVIDSLRLTQLYSRVNKFLSFDWGVIGKNIDECIAVTVDLIKSFPDTKGNVRDYLICLIAEGELTDIYSIRKLGQALGIEDSLVNATR